MPHCPAFSLCPLFGTVQSCLRRRLEIFLSRVPSSTWKLLEMVPDRQGREGLVGRARNPAGGRGA